MKRNELPNILYKNIDVIKPYPLNVELVKEMINITAFFPGGRGLWLEDSTDEFPSILVLGQDFSTVKQYENMLQGKASDLESPTWRNLIKLFKEASIDLKENDVIVFVSDGTLYASAGQSLNLNWKV